MHGHIWCINLRLGLALVEDGVIGQALRELNLDVAIRKVCNVRLRIRAEAKNVGVIELNLGPGVRSSRNLIAFHNRLIQDNG